VELSSTVVFENDSIEAFAYDPVNRKLAITSHSGNVQLSNIGKNGASWSLPLQSKVYSCVWTGILQHLWKAQLGDSKSKMITVIPRAIHYTENYQTLVVFGLETGEVWVSRMVTIVTYYYWPMAQAFLRLWKSQTQVFKIAQVWHVSLTTLMTLQGDNKLMCLNIAGMPVCVQTRSFSWLTIYALVLTSTISLGPPQ
jgi:hypothetical protein